MSEVAVLEIRVNDDYCGRCLICSSLCPYDAIPVEEETGKVKIDLEKCQLCGLCYSACPVNAIETVYYDYTGLVERVRRMADEKKTDTLVLMCRGNSPSTCNIHETLDLQNVDNYIPLRIPCAGRVPTEFILRTLASGIKRIVSVRCEEDFCRFKEGSRINNQRLLLTEQILNELGYKDETLRTTTYSRKAVYDTQKCVGCDKCVFVCPYEAIDVESFATPVIKPDECVGCGACALVCPHLAIQLEGFEYETFSNQIKLLGEAATKLKSKGVSPLILAFCCQWSEFSALDQPETTLFKNQAAIIEIPCFKSLDPYLVVEALHSGFDGVLALVCSETDCKLEKGYELAERNSELLQRVLKELDLNNRFSLHPVAPRNKGEFEKTLANFIQKVSSLPPPHHERSSPEPKTM